MKKLKIISAVLISIIIIVSASAFVTTNPKTFKPIKYVLRGTNEIVTEDVYKQGWIQWLYNDPFGSIALHTLAKRKFVSAYYGKKMDDPESVSLIDPFIRQYDIPMYQYVKQNYKSFNDFFTRKIKPQYRPVSPDSNVVSSPADGKLLVFTHIKPENRFFMKGHNFTLEEFLDSSELANEFTEGTMYIIRLAPVDYHRYHFPYPGTPDRAEQIDGDYFSVSPLALRKISRVFVENKREITLVDTDKGWRYAYIDVGATMVGGIEQTYTPNRHVNKGDEKGYFYFGGSTVVLLFPEGTIQPDKDLIRRTLEKLEVKIQMGEQIGVVK